MMENENFEEMTEEEGADFEEAADFPPAALVNKEPDTDIRAGAKKEAPALIYVGPSFTGAKRFTVYLNGLPEELEEKTEKDPVFKGLVLPVEELAGANTELARQGSGLNILYQEAEKKLAEGSE